MGWLSENDYEIRVSRRDGRPIRSDREPRPVVETFDLDDNRKVREIVGKHFVRMAACAEGEEVHSGMRIKQMQSWLPDYQCEIWRTWGGPREPELVSLSTEGWHD